MSYVPEVGAPFSRTDLDMILEAMQERKVNFPDEPAALTLYFVICGIGERFRKIQCVEQEWECLKKDIPEGEGQPTCPNGHSLHEGPSITIGWVPVD